MKSLFIFVGLFVLTLLSGPSVVEACCIDWRLPCERCLVQCCRACKEGPCMYCNIFNCNCDPCPTANPCWCMDSKKGSQALPVEKTNFGMIDTNKNGIVTLKEVRAWWSGQPKDKRAHLPKGFSIDDAFKDADKNNDEKITFEESGCANQKS